VSTLRCVKAMIGEVKVQNILYTDSCYVGSGDIEPVSRFFTFMSWSEVRQKGKIGLGKHI